MKAPSAMPEFLKLRPNEVFIGEVVDTGHGKHGPYAVLRDKDGVEHAFGMKAGLDLLFAPLFGQRDVLSGREVTITYKGKKPSGKFKYDVYELDIPDDCASMEELTAIVRAISRAKPARGGDDD